MSLNIMHNFLKNWKKKRNTYDFGRAGQELWRWLRRWTNPREGAGKQSPWGNEGGRSQERQEEPGAGGAQQDSGHSHDDGPQWSWWREEPWLPTPGGQTTAAEQVVEEPEAETESRRARGMPRIRGARVEQRTLATRPGDMRRNRSDWGPRWSKREEEAQQSRWDGATKCSQRIGVQRRWRVDAQPRQSRRDEGAQWSDGWRWRRGS